MLLRLFRIPGEELQRGVRPENVTLHLGHHLRVLHETSVEACLEERLKELPPPSAHLNSSL